MNSNIVTLGKALGISAINLDGHLAYGVSEQGAFWCPHLMGIDFAEAVRVHRSDLEVIPTSWSAKKEKARIKFEDGQRNSRVRIGFETAIGIPPVPDTEGLDGYSAAEWGPISGWLVDHLQYMTKSSKDLLPPGVVLTKSGWAWIGDMFSGRLANLNVYTSAVVQPAALQLLSSTPDSYMIVDESHAIVELLSGEEPETMWEFTVKMSNLVSTPISAERIDFLVAQVSTRDNDATARFSEEFGQMVSMANKLGTTTRTDRLLRVNLEFDDDSVRIWHKDVMDAVLEAKTTGSGYRTAMSGNFMQGFTEPGEWLFAGNNPIFFIPDEINPEDGIEAFGYIMPIAVQNEVEEDDDDEDDDED